MRHPTSVAWSLIAPILLKQRFGQERQQRILCCACLIAAVAGLPPVQQCVRNMREADNPCARLLLLALPKYHIEPTARLALLHVARQTLQSLLCHGLGLLAAQGHAVANIPVILNDRCT